jgi:hypothetical protein
MTNEIYTEYAQFRQEAEARTRESQIIEAQRAAVKEAEKQAKLDKANAKKLEAQELQIRLNEVASATIEILEQIRINEPVITSAPMSWITKQEFPGNVIVRLKWGEKLSPTKEEAGWVNTRMNASVLTRLTLPERFVYADYHFLALGIKERQRGTGKMMYFAVRDNRCLDIRDPKKTKDILLPYLAQAVGDPLDGYLEYNMAHWARGLSGDELEPVYLPKYKRPSRQS